MNGIIGLLKIDETHFEDKALIQENHKKDEDSSGLFAFPYQ